MPAHENGTIERPSSASSSARAPSRPGSTMPGCVSSKAMPRMPPRKSSVIRLGSSRMSRSRSCSGSSRRSTVAPASSRRRCLRTVDAAVALREQRGQVGRRSRSITFSLQRLVAPSSCAGSAGRPRSWAPPPARRRLALRPLPLGEEAHLRLGVVDQLGAQVAADVAAAHVDRRGGAGVRGGHHGREVAGLEHEEAGARGARAARGDERDDRHRRAQLGLRDLAHRRRAGRPACRARARSRRRARRPRRMDLVDDPVGRDGVDVGVEHDDAHVRRLGGGTRRQRESRRGRPRPGGTMCASAIAAYTRPMAWEGRASPLAKPEW